MGEGRESVRRESGMMRCLLAGALSALAVAAAAAADFPTKPLRIIIGFPPGGATDLVARLLTPKLSEALKQQVIVDNRPGANGALASELTAKAAPDGYTVHIGTLAALVITPAITKVSYDPFNDFSPIGRTVALQNIFIAHPTLPVKNIQDLIALARARPGKLNFASSGTGSTGHLSGELLKTMANIDMTHIPYKGGGPALTDLLGGQVELFVAIISTAVPQVQAGKARALAVTGDKRSAVLPDVPTVSESGVKGYESTNWYCMLGPPGMPKPIVGRWHKEMTAALNAPEIKQALYDRGIDAAPTSPAELTAYLKSETVKWTRVVKASNIKPD
jgi:tripartite-type tricarboxylate transporter receptor subunit TctC